MLHENIKAAMRDRGLTQADVAAALGMSQAAISRKLSGQSGWRHPEIVKVAVLLAVDVGSLFDESI